jgi:hypothetical protein
MMILKKSSFGPGDTGVILPGYNAWVVGNEPVVVIDFTSLMGYALEVKQRRSNVSSSIQALECKSFNLLYKTYNQYLLIA